MSVGPAPLNRQPEGLLDFLGIKNAGRYPQTLGEQLTPVWDLQNWYLQFNSDLVFSRLITFPAATGAVNEAAYGIGPTTPIALPTPVLPNDVTVPQNEYWLLLEADVHWVMAAGVNGDTDWGFRYSITNVATVYLPMSGLIGRTRGLAGASTRGERVLLAPAWIPPNAVLQFHSCGQFVDGQLDVQGHVRVVRFRR